MSKRKELDEQDGVILDENERLRHDAGEELKDEYDRANAYEKDRIELRGIIFFVLGLVFTCVVSFILMWLMQQAMEVEAAREDKRNTSPMALTDKERAEGKNLPPEPRLQAAPGFGVQRETGATESLELREPQSEYEALRDDWEKVWKEGRKDPKTGTVITIPIEQAKQKVLQEGIGKVRAPEQAQKSLEQSRLVPAYSSSGRTTEIRRQ